MKLNCIVPGLVESEFFSLSAKSVEMSFCKLLVFVEHCISLHWKTVNLFTVRYRRMRAELLRSAVYESCR